MRLWIKFIGSALCLAALLWWTDPRLVLTRLSGADPIWVTFAFLAITCATLSMARRWQIAARAFGLDLRYTLALREYYLAQLINTVLPGGVAGDVTRAIRARAAADLPRAAQSVMAERLLGQIAMFCVLGAGIVVTLVPPAGPQWGVFWWGVPGLVFAAGVVLCALARSHTAMGSFLRKTLRLHSAGEIIFHGAMTSCALIFALYACARAIDVVIPPVGWTLLPLILCAMLIPLSIGGWGWREGAAAALFPLIGLPASAGVATGIAYGIVLVIAVLPAVFILICPYLLDIVSSKGRPRTP